MKHILRASDGQSHGLPARVRIREFLGDSVLLTLDTDVDCQEITAPRGVPGAATEQVGKKAEEDDVLHTLEAGADRLRVTGPRNLGAAEGDLMMLVPREDRVHFFAAPSGEAIGHTGGSERQRLPL